MHPCRKRPLQTIRISVCLWPVACYKLFPRWQHPPRQQHPQPLCPQQMLRHLQAHLPVRKNRLRLSFPADGAGRRAHQLAVVVVAERLQLDHRNVHPTSKEALPTAPADVHPTFQITTDCFGCFWFCGPWLARSRGWCGTLAGTGLRAAVERRVACCRKRISMLTYKQALYVIEAFYETRSRHSHRPLGDTTSGQCSRQRAARSGDRSLSTQGRSVRDNVNSASA